MTVGTLELATAAVEHHDSTVMHNHSNDEWTYLGCGAFRFAYLHVPTQVVYKVARWNPEVSDAEVAAVKRLRKMIWQGVYIPKADRHVVPSGAGEHYVVAMEYIDAPLAWVALSEDWEAGASYPGRVEFRVKSDIWDMHMKNWLLAANGVMIPIDMGDEG